MKTLIFLFLATFLLLKKGNTEIYRCIESAKKFEKIYRLPENLLVSIALTESGKRLKNGEFVAWPWTINMKGKGKFFNSKEKALQYVKGFIQRGRKNIDMGCMQVNHMYHPNAFINLEKAFDPETNVEWSANLIKNLYQKYGSYREAVGYYHSYRTIKKNQYASKVFNTWKKLNRNDVYANIKANNDNALKSNISLKSNKNSNKVNQRKGNTLTASNKKSSLKNIDKERKQKINSAYIVARMEKVKFFRNYFLK
tara:strand:+ start:968 stop:1729 length:762 start_codon:yes stop_codon:yes gene_type:complete